MTMDCQFLKTGKQLLDEYQLDNFAFHKFKCLGIETTSKQVIEVIQEIFKDGNIKAMQALIDAGFAFSDDDNKKITSGIFASSLLKLNNKNYNDLVKNISQAHKHDNFYQILELLIFKFNYHLNLNEINFLLNDLPTKGKNISKDLSSWFEMVRECTKKCERLGHVLGLSGDISVRLSTWQSQKSARARMNFEGSFDIRSYSVLIGKLIDYRNTLPIYSALRKHFETIIDAFRYMFSKLKEQGYQWNAPWTLLEKYYRNELTNLIAGWEGHSFSITLYRGYLILCNRGENGDQFFGTKIYKIKTGAITEHWIKQILDKFLSAKDFNLLLSTAIDFANPIATFPTKGQKHGTCSYVNILSSIEAILCLLEAERKGVLTPEWISRQAEQMTQPLNRIHGQYKTFTTFNRVSEIDDLIKEMKETKRNKILRAFYYELTKAIISQHHGKTTNVVKKENERRAVCQLFEALTEDEKSKMLLFFRITDITDLFQDKGKLLLIQEEYIEETLSLPERKLQISKLVDLEETIQIVIESIERMDFGDRSVLTHIKTSSVCFASYFDTLKNTDANSKYMKHLQEEKIGTSPLNFTA